MPGGGGGGGGSSFLAMSRHFGGCGSRSEKGKQFMVNNQPFRKCKCV